MEPKETITAGKKPAHQPFKELSTTEATGAIGLRLRDLVLGELTKRLSDTLFDDMLARGLKGEAPDGCHGGCMGSCHGACDGSCKDTCAGSCGAGCGSCTGDCKSTCTGDCSGTAEGKGRPEMPFMEDILSQYILTVSQPAMEAFKLVLIQHGFPR